ncbi:tagaturonate reductase [Escherichia coli]|nr:tagaturonate reductase [Escherichia coli]MBV0817078.1 tagaturonate reductase [Escherichia coli]MBV0822012.1 tagaturonate reductase [Escherichia coli]MBV0849722.1 tagaturonate reductase [Escherichia coli]MBV0854678.1 tagaturonate reductase [Escherichia coli]
MKTLNRRDFPGAQYPERIIQFGEGNFLRAFVDWQIDLLNEHTDLNSGVVVVRPIETSFPPSLSTQDGLYTTIIRGLNEKGEAVSDARLIRSVNREISVYSEYDEFLKLAHNPEMRFVFSNTTEAGISYHAGDKFDDAPAVSYPAKLTRLLFERFSHFNGALDKGWIIIPCELIDYNGDALRELVLRYAQEWALPEAFIQWLDQANSFCSTLVDRIVTGYPRDEVAKLEEELGYHDGFLDTAEHFYLFVIQGPKSLATELRLDKYPLNVLIVDDIKPYKERKVAILNGAHTALVPVAFQAGLDTVGEAMNDAEICAFVEKAIYEEIIPVLDLPRDELESFASAVTGRFRNPYIKHQLLSIALNGMTKFRTRILPQLLAGQKAKGTLPARLTFALAALIAFYRGERNGETYPVQDDAHWLERYQQLWSQHRDRVIGTQELVAIVLAEKDHWEQDLTQVPGLVEPRDELESFASAVTGRFRNPYIKHQLLSIALNGMTKFRTRILPQLLAGQKAKGTLPARLTFALAALIAFYRGERNGETYPVQDDAHWLERYQQLWSQHRDRVIGTQELVAIVLAEKDHWEQDLTQVPGLVEQVANDLDAILEKGMREAVRPLC